MKKVILATTALVMIFTSCQKNEETENVTPKHIKVDAGMSTITRATDTKFEDGDKISVYASVEANFDDATSLVVDNSINTLSILGGASTWSAETLMAWKSMLIPHYFVAIYPVRDVAFTDFKNYEFTLTGNNKENDLLFATNTTGIKESDGVSVPLSFEHSQSKLVVNLTFKNQFGDAGPTVEKVTVLANNVALVNFIAKTTDEKSGVAVEIAMKKVLANEKYESVIVPQTVKKITITIDGKNYIYNNTTGIKLLQGKRQTINLIVGRDQIELGSITINDWLDGTVINDGEAEVE